MTSPSQSRQFPHADTCDLVKFDVPTLGYDCTCHVAAIERADRTILHLIKACEERQAENARLRQALERIVTGAEICDGTCIDKGCIETAGAIATEALKERK